MKIQYISHACLKIFLGDVTMLTDPWILNLPVKATSVWKFPSDIQSPKKIISDVNRIYISHSHEDHFHIPSLDLFNREIEIYIAKYPEQDFKRDKLIFNVLKLMGFRNITILSPWVKISLNQDLFLTLVPAAISRYFDWENSGLVIEMNNFKILHMNDNVPDKDLCIKIKNKIGYIDMVFIQTAGISSYPSCFDFSTTEKEKLIAEKINDFTYQDIILDILKPEYVCPFAGDFGWYHKFQINHNFFARSSPVELYKHIKKKGYKLVPMEPSDIFSIKTGLIPLKQRINWNKYEKLVSKELDTNKKEINKYFNWLNKSSVENLYQKTNERIKKINKYYLKYDMKVNASISYYIKGSNSNFSIVIDSKKNKSIHIYLSDSKYYDVDQIYIIPEFIWASIIDGKILWNNVQWFATIIEISKFNNDIRDLIFWLGYYIDLGSRNPEVLLDAKIINGNGNLLRLNLGPKLNQ